jgi:hypothetical protein
MNTKMSEIEKYEIKKAKQNERMKMKYHTDPEEKAKRNKFTKEYLKNRYNNDDEFKAKMQKYQRDRYQISKEKRLIEIEELKIIEDKLANLSTS